MCLIVEVINLFLYNINDVIIINIYSLVLIVYYKGFYCLNKKKKRKKKVRKRVFYFVIFLFVNKIFYK